jgi:hypothetical protein
MLLGLSGCGARQLYDKTIEVQPGVVQSIILEDLGNGWKVNVEITSDVPISAYLVLPKDQQAATAALQAEKAPATSLTGDAKTTSKTLEATMPEKSDLVILLANPVSNRKNASVKVKVVRP